MSSTTSYHHYLTSFLTLTSLKLVVPEEGAEEELAYLWLGMKQGILIVVPSFHFLFHSFQTLNPEPQTLKVEP